MSKAYEIPLKYFTHYYVGGLFWEYGFIGPIEPKLGLLPLYLCVDVFSGVFFFEEPGEKSLVRDFTGGLLPCFGRPLDRGVGGGGGGGGEQSGEDIREREEAVGS